MAAIVINISKNLREKLGEEGVQEFVSILNQMNTAQAEEMERFNDRTYEKFQCELVHDRELLSSQIERSTERLSREMKQLGEWSPVICSNSLSGRHFVMERMIMHKFENLESEHVQARDPFRNGDDRPISSMDEIFAKHKTYLRRWMFFFWATTMTTILAGYFIK